MEPNRLNSLWERAKGSWKPSPISASFNWRCKTKASKSIFEKERGISFGNKKNLALIYDADDDIIDVFKVKEILKTEYNVSLFARQKNMKNFFERIGEVADYVTTFKDFNSKKEIRKI